MTGEKIYDIYRMFKSLFLRMFMDIKNKNNKMTIG